MTPEQFARWLAAMKRKKLVEEDQDCAKLLGLSQNSISTMKLHSGCDTRTALACAALLAGLLPYPKRSRKKKA